MAIDIHRAAVPVSKTLISLQNATNAIRTVTWKPDGGKD